MGPINKLMLLLSTFCLFLVVNLVPPILQTSNVIFIFKYYVQTSLLLNGREMTQYSMHVHYTYTCRHILKPVCV
jgi:hypothetical protein